MKMKDAIATTRRASYFFVPKRSAFTFHCYWKGDRPKVHGCLFFDGFFVSFGKKGSFFCFRHDPHCSKIRRALALGVSQELANWLKMIEGLRG